MATKSFLKDVVIKDKRSAMDFLVALEEAEKAQKEKKSVEYKTIDDKKTLKEMFNL